MQNPAPRSSGTTAGGSAAAGGGAFDPRRFLRAADLTPAMLWASGPDWRSREFSRGWLAPLGSPSPARVAEQWLAALNSARLAGVRQALEAAYERGEPCCVEYALATHQGERVFRDEGTPHLDQTGALAGFAGCCQDVTNHVKSRRELREYQQQFHAMFEQTAFGVGIADLEGRLILVNPEFARMLGRQPEEMRGTSVFELTHPLDRAETSEKARLLLEGAIQDYSCEKRYLRKDGGVVWSRTTVTLLRDEHGAPERLLGAIQDITKEKTALAENLVILQRLQLAQRAGGAGVFEWRIPEGAVYWSPELEYLYGLDEGRFEGTFEDWMRRVVPEDVRRVSQQVEQWLEERREDCVYEFRAILPGGAHRWLTGQAKFFYGDDGTPLRMLGVNVNMDRLKSVQQELTESEERFRTLADNMSQFAWMADAEGWVFWYNRRWYEYTGTTLEEMQGWGWKRVLHPDHVDRVVKKLQHSWDTGAIWEDTFPLRGKDGRYRWFLSRALPMRDEQGEVVRWLGTNTDITTQREAEESLRETDRRKNEFLAMLAHELRNPLAPIRSGLDLLTLGEDPDEARGTLDVMRRQVDQLTRLIDDLLDVSRVMRGKVSLRKGDVELREVVQLALEASRPILQAKEHTLVERLAVEPMWLHADAARLAQVLGNLLNNAAKYTNAGGRIEITTRRAGAKAVISVRDTGVGIEPGLLPNVFDLFTQATRSLDRSQGGLGIGLTVVRQMITLHKGTVKVESEGVGHGSTFTIRLPLIDAPAIQEQERAANMGKQPLPPRRILVVDDNQSAAYLLSRLLQKLGDHTIRQASDGQQAIAALEEFRPEVVFLDIGLPGMDGYQVAAELRRRSEGRPPYIVALSGYNQDARDEETSRECFDRRMTKPADIRMIDAVLRELPATT